MNAAERLRAADEAMTDESLDALEEVGRDHPEVREWLEAVVEFLNHPTIKRTARLL